MFSAFYVKSALFFTYAGVEEPVPKDSMKKSGPKSIWAWGHLFFIEVRILELRTSLYECLAGLVALVLVEVLDEAA